MKVVFVCTGNMCRSPMLKFMFKGFLDERGVTDIDVDSVGTMHHKKPMSENAQAVLRMNRVNFCEHVSKFCDEKVLDGADFIFAMTREHVCALKELYGDKYPVIALADVIGEDVPDPYGRGLAAYEEIYSLFKSALFKIYDYIQK